MSLLVSGPPRRARERCEINSPRRTTTAMIRMTSNVDIPRVLSTRCFFANSRSRRDHRFGWRHQEAYHSRWPILSLQLLPQCIDWQTWQGVDGRGPRTREVHRFAIADEIGAGLKNFAKLPPRWYAPLAI